MFKVVPNLEDRWQVSCKDVPQREREDNVEVDDCTQLSIKFTNFRVRQRITPPVVGEKRTGSGELHSTTYCRQFFTSVY
jgi:hypothetical protein